MKYRKIAVAAILFCLNAGTIMAEESWNASAMHEDKSGLVSFLLSPGDKLNIQVYREPELTGVFIVDLSGNINYPLLGDVRAQGLSMDNFRRKLTAQLDADYLVNPQVKLDLIDSPTNSVAVLGQVTKPGSYVLHSDMTLLRLVSQAGGFTLNADQRATKIVRKNEFGRKEVIAADLVKIINGESADIRLMPGDLVYLDQKPDLKTDVASVESVSILGQVSKPGNYPFTPETTIVRLVSQAGGFTRVADAKNVRITRNPAGASKKVFEIDASRIMDGLAEDIKLEARDLVFVPESLF